MIKNLKLKKNIVTSLISFSIITTTLVGCNETENVKVKDINMSEEQDSYDLKNNKNYVIIETIDSAGNKDIHFAERIRLSKVENPIKKVNKYSDYTDLDKAFPTNTYLYLDLDTDVLAVYYTDPNVLNKENIDNESYIIKEIISEIPAYSEAVNFYGEKDSYQKDEIELMMINLKENYKEKVKIK